MASNNNQWFTPTAYTGGAPAFLPSLVGPGQMNWATPPGFSPPQANVVAPTLPAFGDMGELGGILGDSSGGMPGYGAGNSFTDLFKNFNFKDFTRLMGGGVNADGTRDMGIGSSLVGGFGALSSYMLGQKQLGLAKDQLNFAKDSFAKNWGAQVATTNSQLSDRQAARVASNPGAYESVSSYMNKNGIKP